MYYDISVRFLVDDDNQIILQPFTSGDETYESEYINASYIDVSPLDINVAVYKACLYICF